MHPRRSLAYREEEVEKKRAGAAEIDECRISSGLTFLSQLAEGGAEGEAGSGSFFHSLRGFAPFIVFGLSAKKKKEKNFIEYSGFDHIFKYTCHGVGK